MAPPALIDYVYVVAHEVVHLKVHTHSDAFWAELAQLMPDYKIRRRLLREVGPWLTL